MKSINNVDIEVGNSDIPISIFSAVDKETSFKQMSSCCSASVKYQRVCSECGNVLEFSEIKKAIEVGDELKEINVENIKSENGNLKVLGVLEYDSEEDNVFKDGTIWFIGSQTDKRNKAKTKRNLLKYTYLKESLKLAGQSLLCLISVRGKEHIILLKPYYNAFVGLGIYHFDRIRDVKEIYGEEVEIDKAIVKQMAISVKEKDRFSVKDIENNREKLIERELEIGTQAEPKKAELENPIELVNF